MLVSFQEVSNEIFTNVFYDVSEAKTRYVVVYGGASSGKSYAVHQLELINIMEEGKGDTLIIRKHGADIRESCFKLLQTLIDDWEIKPLFNQRYSNDQRKITYKETGRSIIFKGIDDSEKLKSIVGIKRIIIEEANQLLFEDFLELNRRDRGIADIQIIFILNPVSENHWIKTKFCDIDSPYRSDTTVLRFTYKDNCNLNGESFLTEADMKALEDLKTIDENHYRIYVQAEWGIDNKEGKFVWAFDTKSQIKKTELDRERITWATFDFNVNPLTCTIVQVLPEIKTVRAIECFKLENSDIYKMCERLQAAYPEVQWKITGDASGTSRSAMVKDNINYYTIICQQLRISPQQIQVPSVNPRIEDNQILVNAVHKNWTVEIDPDRCQPLIYDLTYVEVNGRGEIVKDRSSSKKFADFLDNWRYVLNIAVKPHIYRNP